MGGEEGHNPQEGAAGSRAPNLGESTIVVDPLIYFGKVSAHWETWQKPAEESNDRSANQGAPTLSARGVGMHDFRKCSAHLQLLLLLLLLQWRQHVSAFVLMPGNATGRVDGDLTELNHYVYRWSMPVDSGSNEGLGGGLSWVLDPKFCQGMLPQFPEGAKSSWMGYSFLTCNDILVALARGFATWEANHKHIQFRDVRNAEACADRSAALGDPCAWQLYVGTDDGKMYPNLAAYVVNHRTSAFPATFPTWWEVKARSPAGMVDAAVDPFQRSVMRFQTHICWYLDATFCYAFHAMQEEQGLDVRCCSGLLRVRAKARGRAVRR